MAEVIKHRLRGTIGPVWDVVDSSDHDREVSRLQGARARNLVSRVRWWAEVRVADWSASSLRHYGLRYRLADRIAAKYLETP